MNTSFKCPYCNCELDYVEHINYNLEEGDDEISECPKCKKEFNAFYYVDYRYYATQLKDED